tara:strand:- start:1402 stop:2160 length:759 start_codon:yes stop_codon:yes gene_type:complete
MRPYAFLLIFLTILCCSKKNDSSTELEILFTQSWSGQPITAADFNAIQFRNAAGELLSIERLRYLISDLRLQLKNGEELPIKAYHLIDLQKQESLSLKQMTFVAPDQIEALVFIFGFDNESNTDGAYPELNSAVWNVPRSLGGGYHFMQLDGKFEDSQGGIQPYNFHAIRAADHTDPIALVFEDTYFELRLPVQNSISRGLYEINMDVSEWFDTPNLWRLELDSTGLMTNFEAQKKLAENGKTVFSIRNSNQ